LQLFPSENKLLEMTVTSTIAQICQSFTITPAIALKFVYYSFNKAILDIRFRQSPPICSPRWLSLIGWAKFGWNLCITFGH